MLLGGLWHGANWTFVIFGAIHGAAMSIERFFLSAEAKLSEGASRHRYAAFLRVWAKRILTFNIFCLSLAFFRSPSIGAALEFLGGLFRYAWQSQYAAAFVMLAIFSVPLFLVDLLLEARNQEYPFAEAPYAVRTGLAVVAFLMLAFFSQSKFNTFIYFQF